MEERLLVTSEELLITAGDFLKKAEEVKSLSDEMIIKTTDVLEKSWTGEASEKYRAKFLKLQSNMNRINNMIQEYVSGLNTVARQYENISGYAEMNAKWGYIEAFDEEKMTVSDFHKIEKHSWLVPADTGEMKTLEFVHGDLCEIQKECDLIVCSAYKNAYAPTPKSMLGSLYQKGIDVGKLAQNPQLDFKFMGCWMSHSTGTGFKRIACVELLDYSERYTEIQTADIILKKAFSTLKFMLEQASISEIPVQTIALPILGGGYEKIEIPFILSTLSAQCREILRSNSGVKKIIFYEQNPQKFQISVQLLHDIFDPNPRAQTPEVFISYSSKQTEQAEEICEFLRANNISCWMAPDSIPAGSNYIEMIPLALEQVKIVVVLLTPDAEKSKWVQKEVSTAIGSGKYLIPYQMEEYPISMPFQFLLDGEQILQEYRKKPGSKYRALLDTIQQKLNTMKGSGI